MYWIIAIETKDMGWFLVEFLFAWNFQNMRNCNLSDFKKELLFVMDVQNKFLVADICSEMPSDSK